MNKKTELNLNKFLASSWVMFTKLHNLHWYVVGKDFFSVHVKLQQFYEYYVDVIDDVAEKMIAADGTPVASLKKSLSLSFISELEDKEISVDKILKILIKDFTEFKKAAEVIISDVRKENLISLENLFVGYYDNFEKTLWMLNATAK